MTRLAAVFLGGVFSLLVVSTFIQEPVLLSVVIGLLIFGVVYRMTSSVDQVVFANVGITISVLVLVACSSHEQLEVVVFDCIVTLVLGAVIGLAMSITLRPVSVSSRLQYGV